MLKPVRRPFPNAQIARREVEVLRVREALQAAIESGHPFEFVLTSWSTGQTYRQEVSAEEGTE